MRCRLKRFLLFQGAEYYPCSGFGDFVDSFDTIGEAKAHPAYIYGQEEEYQWSEIVDTYNPRDCEPTNYKPWERN